MCLNCLEWCSLTCMHLYWCLFLYHAGWFYGAVGEARGSFPVELVTPILGEPTEKAIGQAKLLIKKKLKRDQGERRKQRAGQGLTSPGTLTSVTSQESITSQEFTTGKYCLLEFATHHFRYGQER